MPSVKLSVKKWQYERYMLIQTTQYMSNIVSVKTAISSIMLNQERQCKLGCDNDATQIAQQIASEVVVNNWLSYCLLWAFWGSQLLFLIWNRLFHGLNFTETRPYSRPITTLNQDLFQPEYNLYLVQALIQPESY